MLETVILAVAAILPQLDDRPPAEDVARFPSREYCDGAMKTCCEFYWWCDSKLSWQGFGFRDMELMQAKERADVAYYAWSALRSAHYSREWYDDGGDQARTKLAELRQRIGPAAYYEGRMPSPIPPEFIRPITLP